MTSTDPNDTRVRIAFRLERDDEGYPPADIESLWASPVDGGAYEIDNIPFFVKGVSAGDIVDATLENDELWYAGTRRYGGHWTLRVMVFDESQVGKYRQVVSDFGCATELSHLPRLFAVDVPASAQREDLLAYLAEHEAQDLITYEEAAIT
jgi:hypothetical protein